MTFAARCLGVAGGIVLDELVGEPPNRLHPMVAVGRGLGRLERRTHRPGRPRAQRASGIGHVVISVGLAWQAGRMAERVLGPWLSTTLVVWIASSGRLLRSSAAGVGDGLVASDIAQARRAITWLVGRDPAALDEAELARAAVESVAENTVDAVVGSVVWGVVAGPAGVAVHRVANTLDAMIGHRSVRYRHFGWASARLDDGLNFLPARVGVAAVLLAVPGRARSIGRIVLRDGHRHPSPNGGRIEAAFAQALGVTLGGVNDYAGTMEVRGPLGSGRPCAAADIERANDLSRRVSAIAGIAVPMALAAASRRWSG